MTSTEWINQRFEVALTDDDIANVKDFVLYWNVFEHTVCKKNFSIWKVEKIFKKKRFDETNFQFSIKYFRNRYVTNGKLNDTFFLLKFREEEKHWQNFVEQVLLEKQNCKNNIILASMIIIYRFRNNLFHGEKEMTAIDTQKENFETANRFLQTILNYFP
ncbi:MAG: hypothetical protein FWC94_00100 [Bacteroidales bacterium]|nr:hypothetical protein [Bacteroidales bacterium]